MIDSDGFRENVGIILVNSADRVFWGRRIGQNAWQFPQGGINVGEAPEEAMFRELHEEIGLRQEDVQVLGCTTGWLRYRLPKHFIRYHSRPLCIGQKQKWFMLRLLTDEDSLCFTYGDKPEFDGARWVRYWQPLREVIFFKRQVYRRAMQELFPLLETEKVAFADSLREIAE